MTPHRGRMVIRCLRLYRYLQGRKTRPTIYELGPMFRVSYKTIERDLKALEEAHYVVPPVRQESA